MRKFFIGTVLFGFIAVVICLGYAFWQFYKNFDKPPSAQELSDIAYYKFHGKEIGQEFTIDSVIYSVQNPNFIINSHNVVMKVNLKINNQSSNKKSFENKFFVLKDANKLDYFPETKPFEISQNEPQTINLIYQLPEKMLPYIRYELHFLAQNDSSENAIVIMYKNYRSGG